MELTSCAISAETPWMPSSFIRAGSASTLVSESFAAIVDSYP